MQDKPSITILHRTDGSDVRIGKMCRSLSRMGFSVNFIGWDREPQKTKKIDLGDTDLDVLNLVTKNGRSTILGTLRYIIYCYLAILKKRPQILCTVNEDLTLAFVPFRLLTKTKLVCDIFDPIDDRNSHKAFPFRWGAKTVAFLSRSLSHRLIATDKNRKERLGRFGKKAIVIENMPEDPGPDLCRSLPTGPVKIFVGGSLHSVRGIRQISDAMDQYPNLHIISAGWVRDEASQDLIDRPNVDFKGIVTLQQTLELIAQCDAVLCFYQPTTFNNINASPNKIYDALSVGRPSIVNEEIKISDWFRQKNYGYLCPYDDTAELVEIVKLLAKERDDLLPKAIAWHDEFQSHYGWGLMEPRLDNLYQGLVN